MPRAEHNMAVVLFYIWLVRFNFVYYIMYACRTTCDVIVLIDLCILRYSLIMVVNK